MKHWDIGYQLAGANNYGVTPYMGANKLLHSGSICQCDLIGSVIYSFIIYINYLILYLIPEAWNKADQGSLLLVFI